MFFDRYKKIENRASEQSKKLAYVEYKKVINNLTENDNNPHELLVTCLKQAIIEQQQITKKGGFSTTFPNCFRWLKNGSYETYLPAPEIKKQQNNPWEKDKPKGKEVPFKTMPSVTIYGMKRRRCGRLFYYGYAFVNGI